MTGPGSWLRRAGERVWVAANDDGPGLAGSGGGRSGGGRSYAVAGNLALAEDIGAIEAVLLSPLRFQGQWQDGETGLVCNKFRYYDPSTTQYVSPDPMGLITGVRSSAYVARPTVLVDAYGLVAWAPLGSGICIVQKFAPGSPEVNELAHFVGEWNKEIIGRGGRVTAGPLSDLQTAIQNRWRKAFREENCCRAGKVAGHVPDSAAGGLSNPILASGWFKVQRLIIILAA